MKFQYLLETLLDIFFPRPVDVHNIEKMEAYEMLEKLPKAKEMANNCMKSVFHYKDKVVKKIVWEIKYNANKKLTEKMGVILYDLILEEIGDKICFEKIDRPIIVPVPASKDRLKKYGFNQCEMLVKEIMKNDRSSSFINGIGYIEKTKNTEHQVKTAGRKQRLQNIMNSFIAKDIVSGKFIIVIDDVITTGATMMETRRALVSAGAKEVVCFSIAH